MKRKMITVFSAILLCLTLTACGSSEPASAPSVAESDKSIVQEKLNKQGSGLSGTDSNIADYTGAQVLTAIDMRGTTAQELNGDTKQTVRDWLDNLGF